MSPAIGQAIGPSLVFAPFRALRRLLLWFPATWRLIDLQADRHFDLQTPKNAVQPALSSPPYDTRPAQILIVAALVLIFQWYYGDRPFFVEVFGARLLGSPTLSRYQELLAFSWWSGAKLVGFLLVPMLHIRLMGGQLRDFGMPLLHPPAVPGVGHVPWARIYLSLYLIVLPVLFLVSFTPAFQHTYPFYRLASRSPFDFIAWELQYGATFLTVEFFFRGYLLFGLRPALGSHAIFVMMVPYSMLHVLKPASESFGAVAAGIVLGTLALSTGSIWCGFLIHLSVAWTMDLLSSIEQHALPRWGHFFP